MGYRSDVVLMAVFENAEHHDEVMAVYRMDPRVQAHNCEQEWRRVGMDSGVVVRIFEGTNLKWYESYEAVQGFEYMREVLETFYDNRELSFSFAKMRVGEEENDVEYDVDSNGEVYLADIIYNNLSLTRAIELAL